MRFVLVILLIFSTFIAADIQERIKNDLQQRKLLGAKLRTYPAKPHIPAGLEKIDHWVCQNSNRPVRELVVQKTNAFSVIAYICDHDSRYWLRLQGTVMQLDQWYGPYTFSRKRLNKRFFSRHFKAKRRNLNSTNRPNGLIRRAGYRCRQHYCMTQKVLVADYPRMHAYYCPKGLYYWVHLQHSGWYGPFTLNQTPELTIGVTLNKLLYRANEPIKVQVWVKNNNHVGVWLRFSNGLQADYIIDNIYKYSQGHMTTMALSSAYIPPYGKKVLLQTQHHSHGYYLAPGTHRIVGVVRANNYRRLVSAPVSFQVQQNFEPQPNVDLMSKAIRCIEQGRLQAARKYLKMVIAKEPARALAYYNLACVESLAFQSEEAIRYLATALQLGFDDLAHIRNDRDLDNIRNHPRFQELIYSYFQK